MSIVQLKKNISVLELWNVSENFSSEFLNKFDSVKLCLKNTSLCILYP